jgi:hypothetical protein
MAHRCVDHGDHKQRESHIESEHGERDQKRKLKLEARID